MKIFFKALLLALIVTSCEDVEPTIFNGNDTSNETFISFSQLVYNLPVVRDESGTIEVVLNVSTVSNVDRVYNLTVNEELSTADPSIYTLPSSITVPAGEYQGFAEITANDINVTSDIQTIVFSISNLTNENFDAENYTINVFEVCPLEAPFSGTYIVTGEGKFGPVILEEPIEVIVVSEYVRSFNANFIPEALPGGVDIEDVEFTMSCGQTFLNNTEIDMNAGCSDVTVVYGPGATTGFYIPGDDSQFTLNLTEDMNSSCGGGPVQVSLTFTKQ